MRPLQTYLIFWSSTKQVFLAQLAKYTNVDRWEATSEISQVCKILAALKNEDAEAFNICTVVSPTGFTYNAQEFLIEFCPSSILQEKLPKLSPELEEVVPFTREY